MIVRSLLRQRHHELGPVAGRTRHRQRAAVRLGDLAHDREAHPGSRDAAGLRTAVEALEQPGLLALGNRRTGVPDGNVNRRRRPSP